MPAKDGGYFSRLVRKLTSDVEDLDADDLSERSEAQGAQRACDCRSGDEVTVLGRLRSVELCPTNEAATLQAELFDGTQGVTLIWLGRRRIPGIEPGRTIKVRGRLAERAGQKVLYNPYYELQSPVS
ncbi:OB-fold nucleic acid binding domain-containing protein [Amycolatopsis samaneae]|uniref:OB-fold nucleic acid binding domain-containing protein n=1 Tax=Amycolatopsis samaneae TaxID=664691 RepID=A0ABW5GFQ4_9PSEU